MKTQNTKSSRLPVILLTIIGLGLIAWVVQLRGDLDTLKAESVTLQQRLDAAAKKAKEVATQDEQWRKLGERASVPSSQTADASAPAGDSKADHKRNLNPDELTALIKNPAMQNIIGSQMSAMVQMTYRDLMDKFKLSPEERDYMQKLLVDGQMTKMNIGMQFLNPALSPDDRNALGQQFMQGMAANEAKVHDFLNSDADYAAYQAYNQQEPEHEAVGMFETSLASTNNAMDPATSDALANLMSDTRKNFPFTVDLYNESNFAQPQNLTKDAVSKFLDEQTQYQAQVAGKAADLLTPAQLDAFKQSQTISQQMMKQKLNSITQLTGAGASQ